MTLDRFLLGAVLAALCGACLSPVAGRSSDAGLADVDGANPDGQDGGEKAGDAGLPDAGASSDAGVPPPCKGLDERSCLERPACAGDYCFECTCEQRFSGCRDASATPGSCPPPPGCPTPLCCRGPADCGSPEFCRAPDAPAQCGTCDPAPATCASDTDCAPGMICALVPCSCSGSGTKCVDGCGSDSDCPLGESCGGAHRCEASACATGCLPLFECNASVQHCQRKACSTDDECMGGFCVLGQCYRGMGACEVPVP